MRLFRDHYNLIGAAAALAAVIWSIIQFVATPYWSRLHEQPDNAYVEYLRELHGENLALLREKMLEEITADQDGLEISSGSPIQKKPELSDAEVEAIVFSETAISLDPMIEARMERILRAGTTIMNARSASALLVRVSDGGIVGLASVAGKEDGLVTARESAELGSVLKPVTTAIALETGLITSDQLVDATSPLEFGRFRIRDFTDYGSELTPIEGLVRSSNVVSARLALKVGPEVQRNFFSRLGMVSPSTVEFSEIEDRLPKIPSVWSDVFAMTISYGHGIALTQFHVANFYTTIANGGILTTPTLLPGDVARNERVFSAETSHEILLALEQHVIRGGATFAQVDGLRVGAFTGTANKPNPDGGYFDDQVIATIAAVFPIDNPQFVLVIALDEPQYVEGEIERRTAGWTVAPIASEMISDIWAQIGNN